MTMPTTPIFSFGDCEQDFEASTTTPTAAQAVDSESLRLGMNIVDDPSVELAPAGPPQPLTFAERLEYLPTAVAMCPANSRDQALNVFVWGANGILGGFHEASIREGPEGPFEPGRFFQTAAVPAMRQLNRIRDEYGHDFNEICIDLEAAMADMRGVCRRLRLVRSLTGEVDLDSMAPSEEGAEPASPPDPAGASSSAPPGSPSSHREESSSSSNRDSYPPEPNDDDTNSTGSHESYCDSDVDVTASDGCDLSSDDYSCSSTTSSCSSPLLFSELDPEAIRHEYERNTTQAQDDGSELNVAEGGGGRMRIDIDKLAGLGIDRPSLATGELQQ